ncbi:MAG TPA: DUF4383 domain-containing protein [Solirubrobacteraceae bacterium]
MTATRTLTPVGWAAILGSLTVLVWSVPGLIINPDFAIGDDATSELVLGVDMNGWHAVSGFLVAIPGLLVATRPYLAAVFCVSAAASLIATAIWAVADEHAVGGLFYFPNATGDALLHIATSLIFVAGAVAYHRRAGSR